MIAMQLPEERKRLIRFFALLCILAAGLVISRLMLPVESRFLFLLWNLFLALIPLVISTVIRHAGGSLLEGKAKWLLLALWLLFFPNAPYVLTDWVHVYFGDRSDFVLNLITWGYVAGVSYLAAFISLRDVYHFLSRKYSREWVTLAVFFICLLTGTGIYLGRYLRFNSWDIVARPDELIKESVMLFGSPEWNLRDWLSSSLIGLSLFMLNMFSSFIRGKIESK